MGSGLKKGDRRVVVELLGTHGLDHGDVVGDGGDMGQELAEPCPTLAMLGEFPARPPNVGHALEKSETLLHEGFGDRFAVVLYEIGLVVIEVEVRRGARHEHVDDMFRFRGQMRKLGLDRGFAAGPQERGQRGDAHAGGGTVKELTPGDGFAVGFVEVHRMKSLPLGTNTSSPFSKLSIILIRFYLLHELAPSVFKVGPHVILGLKRNTTSGFVIVETFLELCVQHAQVNVVIFQTQFQQAERFMYDFTFAVEITGFDTLADKLGPGRNQKNVVQLHTNRISGKEPVSRCVQSHG